MPVRTFTITTWKRGALDAAGALARQISHVSPSLETGEAIIVESSDQEWCDAWPRRKRNRTFSDDGRFARGRLRGSDHRPVFASEPETPACCRIHHSGPIRLLRR